MVLQHIQRSGARFGVDVVGAEAFRNRPRGHLHGERYEQEHTPGKCGVEQVLPKTAEGHFANADGERRTNNDDADGQVRRQVERQQQAGQYGRAVADGWLLLEQEFLNQVLKKYATCNRCECYNQRSDSKVINGCLPVTIVPHCLSGTTVPVTSCSREQC